MTPLPRPVWPGRPRQGNDPKPAPQIEQDWWHQRFEQVSRDWQKLVDADIELKARVAELEARKAAQHREPRRIAQITGDDKGVFALCSDGTVWGFQGAGPDWLPLPAIPQHQLAED